ncbi:MAG TPA: tetratricopeptide repeat protein [Terriglobales bacterium]|nr:tetratricopeptide repeat protein [Terriglobales bacterium]
MNGYLAISVLAISGACTVNVTAQTGAASFQSQASSQSDSLSNAKRLIDQDKLDEAIQSLKTLERQYPETKGVQFQLGLAYYRKGDFAVAESALAKAMQEDPQNREAVQLRGLSFFQMGRPADAITYLKQVQSWIGSANVDASYVLGLCYLHTQNYDEARKSFAQMYGVPPESAAAHLFLARMLLRQGYDPVAEQNAQTAAAMEPKLPLVHYLLGEFYLYKSNVQKAIEEFEMEQKLNPGYAGTYDRLGDSYSRVGKYDDAERALQRAILLDATATGPYILMGKVLIKKKDFASAINYLQKALRMDPSNYMSHHLMGEAYRGLGRNEEAERELRRSEELQAAQEAKPPG